jgi:hypothetical protein
MFNRKKDSMSAILEDFTARADSVKTTNIAKAQMADTEAQELEERYLKQKQAIAARKAEATQELESADVFMENIDKLFKARL